MPDEQSAPMLPIYCYIERPEDELEALLTTHRTKRATSDLIAYNVGNDMRKRLDTGIRVNAALARAYGVHSEPSVSQTQSTATIPEDATLCVNIPIPNEDVTRYVLVAFVPPRVYESCA